MEFMTRRERGEQIGEQRGLLRGRAEGVRGLTQKLLQRRLGLLPETVMQCLATLGPEQLEQLGLASLDFASLADLAAWLEQHSQDSTTTP